MIGTYPRPEVKWFSWLMDNQLWKNRDKGISWKEDSLEDLLYRLREETEELAQEIKNGGDSDRICEEAADIANFCMMISNNSMTANK